MSAEGNPWPAIGQLFVEQGRLTDAQLDQALAVQQQTGQQLGEILVTSGLISRLDLASAIGTQWAYQEKAADEAVLGQPEPAPYAFPEPLPVPEYGAAAPLESFASPSFVGAVEVEVAQPIVQPAYDVEPAQWTTEDVPAAYPADPAPSYAADPALSGRIEALEEKGRLIDDLQARLRAVYEQLAAAEARVETLEPLVARLSQANDALTAQFEAQTREFEELRSNSVKVDALATAIRAFFS